MPRKTATFIGSKEVSKIRYVVSGRFNETKRVVIESPAVGPNGLWIVANDLASINPRGLFEINAALSLYNHTTTSRRPTTKSLCHPFLDRPRRRRLKGIGHNRGLAEEVSA